ncbi:cystathionine beta-lyase [Ottowia sp. VDI28]|uniref:cystathionine beta-lyase n=1 Tax=Ottowia sp. VDI28 TaxID=3133968 RepID=UPI003C2C4DB1
MSEGSEPISMHQQTNVTHVGRDAKLSNGLVNIPPYRGSTVLFDKVEQLKSSSGHRAYGRWGTPTNRALESALAELEGGANAMLTPSGLSAITTALLGSVKPGDHVLMVDSVYPPVRSFCDTVLKKMNVDTTYYPPLAGAGIAELIQPNTTVVYTESPGSGTFEVQDIPSICAVARAAGARVLMDNTWSTALLFPALEHGVDLSIHSLTKYVVGHSDALLGAIVARTRELYLDVRAFHGALGITVSPDDAFLGLRGLRTLSVRLKQHQESALQVAQWLREQPQVREVLYPALPGARGHELWKRDFKGASGLFGVVLHPTSEAAVIAMLDGMRLFKMGFSWGGFESLIIPVKAGSHRLASPISAGDVCLRVHVGLEHPQDLIADLGAGFQRLSACAA